MGKELYYYSEKPQFFIKNATTREISENNLQLLCKSNLKTIDGNIFINIYSSLSKQNKPLILPETQDLNSGFVTMLEAARDVKRGDIVSYINLINKEHSKYNFDNLYLESFEDITLENLKNILNNYNLKSIPTIGIQGINDKTYDFLNAAVVKERDDLVKYLLSQDNFSFDINQTIDGEDSTVHNLCRLSPTYGNNKGPEIFDLIVTSGQKINLSCKNSFGQSPFSIAVRRNNEHAVKYFLENNKASIDFNETDSVGRTMLYHAVTNRYLNMSELLLDNKADPNIGNLKTNKKLLEIQRGYNPDDLEIVKLLVRFGADVTQDIVQFQKEKIKVVDTLTGYTQDEKNMFEKCHAEITNFLGKCIFKQEDTHDLYGDTTIESSDIL
ncbi:MAG TPA: ankyrin repeat domain-containing protein [Candidatus Megaira endosymbiont of Nemacystus decipiens]|nr:ankyrin repeat domain-containing protein [Candidatus Megaera endosymbiont of Nemacystus decipiens]